LGPTVPPAQSGSARILVVDRQVRLCTSKCRFCRYEGKVRHGAVGCVHAATHVHYQRSERGKLGSAPAAGLVRSFVVTIEGEEDYGLKASDRISFCRRAGFHRRRGRRCCSHRATSYRSRETWATAQPLACVDFRVPALGWQRLRLGSGKVGATSTAGRPLGSASLGSPKGRLCNGGRALALGPGPLHTSFPHAGRRRHRHVSP
jgi:hypothetical protein